MNSTWIGWSTTSTPWIHKILILCLPSRTCHCPSCFIMTCIVWGWLYFEKRNKKNACFEEGYGACEHGCSIEFGHQFPMIWEWEKVRVRYYVAYAGIMLRTCHTGVWKSFSSCIQIPTVRTLCKPTVWSKMLCTWILDLLLLHFHTLIWYLIHVKAYNSTYGYQFIGLWHLFF